MLSRLNTTPDANQGSPKSAEKFKEVNKAYQTLKDAGKRAEYDETLGGGASRPRSAAPNSRRQSSTAPTQGQAARGPVYPTSGNPLIDILDGIRKQSAQPQPATPAAVTQNNGVPTIEILLTPREAADGVIKTIKVNGRPIRLNIKIRNNG